MNTFNDDVKVPWKRSIFTFGCILLASQILILYPYIRHGGMSNMAVICRQGNALVCFFPFWVYGVLTAFILLFVLASVAFRKSLLKAWWYVIFPCVCVVSTALVLTGLPQYIPEYVN